MNILDLNQQRMANVELYEDDMSVYYIGKETDKSAKIVDISVATTADKTATTDSVATPADKTVSVAIVTPADKTVSVVAIDPPAVAAPGNYSHFNMFKHLQSGMAVDEGDNSTMHRQRRIDAMPAVRTLAGVAAALGDITDPAYPVYRPNTLATIIIDGASGNMTVWANTQPNQTSVPVYRWNIHSFFH
jgi:hypothetical protein